MERKYTYFEYLQVLAMLEQVRSHYFSRNNERNQYCIDITTFDDGTVYCFDALFDLADIKPTDWDKEVRLLKAEFRLDEEDERYLFKFEMGRKSCCIVIDDTDPKNKDDFKEILPFSVEENFSLEKVFSAFMYKIKYIYTNGIKTVY